MAAPDTPVTPEDVCRALRRRLRAATLGTFGPPLTQYPEATAGAVMGYVTPVLEARDARIAELAATLGEILDTWGPRPYPGDETGFFRSHIAVSKRKLAQWHAVRAGKSGSEEEGRSW